MRWTASALWICLAICSLPAISEAVRPIPGDLDLDGDVDLEDFFILAVNYGRVGPVPTVEYGRVDTVYVPGISPELFRVSQLLGFWTFNGLDFLFGQLNQETLDDGEYFMLGSTSEGVFINGGYNKSLGQYLIFYYGPVWEYSFAFNILESGQVFGNIRRSLANFNVWIPYGSLVSSGRNFGSPVGKATLQSQPRQLRTAPPSRNS